jgi:hypothetical protein
VNVVMTLVARGAPDVLDAQVAYHLNAGVGFVVAAAAGLPAELEPVLRRYERDGHLRLVEERAGTRVDELLTRGARLAATEHDADWVLPAAEGEFWWPRGEGLEDVLSPIPPRYTIVQGLRREFAEPAGADGPFFERCTHRPSLEELSGDAPPGLLRPLFRADPTATLGADGGVELGRRIPLRAWYPIEVLRFGGADSAQSADATALVEDTRLRDALRALREQAPAGQGYALPADGRRTLTFRVPDIVDDARYAVECAAVGEVDLPRLEAYVTELEQRVAILEQRFWPRAMRLGSRLLRRGGG